MYSSKDSLGVLFWPFAAPGVAEGSPLFSILREVRSFPNDTESRSCQIVGVELICMAFRADVSIEARCNDIGLRDNVIIQAGNSDINPLTKASDSKVSTNKSAGYGNVRSASKAWINADPLSLCSMQVFSDCPACLPPLGSASCFFCCAAHFASRSFIKCRTCSFIVPVRCCWTDKARQLYILPLTFECLPPLPWKSKLKFTRYH